MLTSSLNIPSTLTAGKATIKVTLTNTNTQGSLATEAPALTSSQDVTVEAKSVSIFIQTDKAMYKPSQTGNVFYFHRTVIPIVDINMMRLYVKFKCMVTWPMGLEWF